VTDRHAAAQLPPVSPDSRTAAPISSAPAAAALEAPTFQDIFQKELPYVWSTLRRLGVPERDLEDVAHDVFLEVHRKFEQFDPRRALRPWLFGFAFRVASSYRRLARNRREILGEVEPRAQHTPDELERLLRAEALEVGYRALSALELDRRAVFILHELDDTPMPEVAMALSLPLNTAYSRLRLARADFQKQVRRLERSRGER
jgi:RNA polymerase sigma-70 factor, ECF subfamily